MGNWLIGLLRQPLGTIALLLLLHATAQAGVLRRDARQLLTPQNLGLALCGLGVAGVAHAWDDDIKGKLEGAVLFETSSDMTNIYGASFFNAPASLGLWVVGKAAHLEKVEQLGSRLARTLAFTQLVVAPIKLAVRRERPDGSNKFSFPSGHTANSVAIARMLHRCYGRRVGIPLYLLSAFVAAGRLEDDRHYLSDVVMGALLGGLVGNSVTLGKDDAVAVWPQLTSGGMLLTLRIEGDF